MMYVVNVNTGESSRYKKGEEYRVIISNPTSSYDIAQLKEWKKFRVLVNRVDTSLGEDVVFPDIPTPRP